MKKKLTLLMLVAFFCTGRLLAQEKDSVTNLPTLTVTAGTIVNKEIDKIFRKTFPEALNLKWYQVNKFYLVKFIENDVKHRALFTKKGMMKYDISYGNENQLPSDMLTKIKEVYTEYNITRVANVKEAGRNIWVINLDNLKHLVLIRMENGEMEEVQKIEKTR
jgi:hypothetical protein